jgi:quinol monooxygenase YgiN
MVRYLRFLLAATAVPLGAGAQAPAPLVHPGEVYIAIYVEVQPGAVGSAIALLKQYRDATRRDAGNLRSELVQETGRPNRFALMAVWSDQKAWEAHAKAPHAAQMREKIAAIQAAPNDERVHNGMFVAAKTAAGPGAIYVLTHVDVPPPLRDTLIPMLKQLAEDSRKGAGNQRYEAQQQNNRTNHFTVVEAWTSYAAYEAFIGTAPKRQFRDKFGPMTGALYDERIYAAVD